MAKVATPRRWIRILRAVVSAGGKGVESAYAGVLRAVDRISRIGATVRKKRKKAKKGSQRGADGKFVKG